MYLTEWQEVRKDIVDLEKKIEEYNEGKDFIFEEENQLIHLLEQAWALVNAKC